MVILQRFTKNMKKLFITLFIVCTCFSSTFALSPDSISTVYENGEYVTHYKTNVKVSSKIANEVCDYLVNDFHTTPDNLFNWALKDLGLQNKNDELIFVLKSSDTDLKSGITYGKFDIDVQNIRIFKDVKVNAIVAKTKNQSKDLAVNADIIYSSLLLKHAVGNIKFISLDDTEQQLVTRVNIKFGWFFNIFITKRRYKSIVEWRIKRFTENIKNECIRRKNLELKQADLLLKKN
jgi:hypothetical protein